MKDPVPNVDPVKLVNLNRCDNCYRYFDYRLCAIDETYDHFSMDLCEDCYNKHEEEFKQDITCPKCNHTWRQ